MQNHASSAKTELSSNTSVTLYFESLIELHKLSLELKSGLKFRLGLAVGWYLVDNYERVVFNRLKKQGERWSVMLRDAIK